MLHSIKEVCDLTGKSRSSIYRMFGRGDLAYMVGKDGKRRVETSELLRVFDEINFNDSPTLAEPIEAPQPQAAQAAQASQGADPYVTARELTDLRGMIHELREELDDLREDNRRLLRLLEYQTVQQVPASTPPPVASPTPPTESSVAVAPQTQEQADPDPLDEEEPVPVTSVAEQGWKAYRQQRVEQEQQKAVVTQTEQPTESGMLNELGVWLKGFFFGEWQKRR